MWTEEEAKKKICPIMRYCINEYHVRDGGAAIYEHHSCAASSCMAWRWNEEPVQMKSTTSGSGPPAGDDWTKGASNGRFQWWYRPMPNRQGHCGLAGDGMLTLNTEPSK